MMRFLGRLVGIDDLERIDEMSLGFAASWATSSPIIFVLLAAGLTALSIVFYRRFQPSLPGRWTGMVLTAMRAALLVLLLLLLAEPIVALATSERYRPLLVFLFDASESMAIVDRTAAEDAEGLADLIKPGDLNGDAEADAPSRMAMLRAVIDADNTGVFDQLNDRYRLRAYVMDRTDQVREIDPRQGAEGKLRPDELAGMLETEGQVSAYGAAFEDLYRRHQAHRLAGVVVLGDFVQNAGPPALPAALRLDRPFYTVGLGPSRVTDVSIDMTTRNPLRKDERNDVTIHLRQSGLDGQTTRVQLYARPYGSSEAEGDARLEPIGEPRVVVLEGESQSFTLPFHPEQTGRYALEARVEPVDDETLADNNTVSREVFVTDKSLQLLFIEYQPTWEWRFIKEVFHRDVLVGEEGFRTFLRSASLKVRRENPLFLESLIRPRSEFFAYDIIIISDVPAEMLSADLQKLLTEYVTDFGGGLVFLAGPNFGPQALADTELAALLPVVPARGAARVDRPFRLQRTPAAAEYEFMRLGQTDAETDLAWQNMGELPWYQPVVRPHPFATVLASHPTDRSIDGEQPQPLIAARRVGRGEVVYFGFNETWRLRRLYGDEYYRQLWGGLIQRLGTARAMGQGKRFVVRTDRPTYRSGDKVMITAEAYNENFGDLDVERLTGRLVVTPTDSEGEQVVSEIVLPLARDRVIFETDLPVFAAGRYRLLITDPVTRNEVEASFSVTSLSIERRSTTRDADLQIHLATQTGGHALELSDFARLPELIQAEPIRVTTTRQVPLGHTWLMLLLVLSLMFGEWLIRKLSNMR